MAHRGGENFRPIGLATSGDNQIFTRESLRGGLMTASVSGLERLVTLLGGWPSYFGDLEKTWKWHVSFIKHMT